MAHGLKDDEVADLKEAFSMFDIDGDGTFYPSIFGVSGFRLKCLKICVQRRNLIERCSNQYTCVQGYFSANSRSTRTDLSFWENLGALVY